MAENLVELLQSVHGGPSELDIAYHSVRSDETLWFGFYNVMGGGLHCKVVAMTTSCKVDPQLQELLKGVSGSKLFEFLLFAPWGGGAIGIHIQYALPIRKGVVLFADHYFQTEQMFGFRKKSTS